MQEEAVRDLDWQTHAACRDANIEKFYSGEPDDTREAVRVCRSCPVRRPCFEAALDRGEIFGVWGGTTERERRRMLREAARAGASTAA